MFKKMFMVGISIFIVLTLGACGRLIFRQKERQMLIPNPSFQARTIYSHRKTGVTFATPVPLEISFTSL